MWVEGSKVKCLEVCWFVCKKVWGNHFRPLFTLVTNAKQETFFLHVCRTDASNALPCEASEHKAFLAKELQTSQHTRLGKMMIVFSRCIFHTSFKCGPLCKCGSPDAILHPAVHMASLLKVHHEGQSPINHPSVTYPDHSILFFGSCLSVGMSMLMFVCIGPCVCLGACVIHNVGQQFLPVIFICAGGNPSE